MQRHKYNLPSQFAQTATTSSTLVALWIVCLSATNLVADETILLSQPEQTPARPGPAQYEETEQPLTSLTIDISPPEGEVPENVASEVYAQFGSQAPVGDPSMGWVDNTFTGHATPFCHRPLYFEETFLERYGHKTCLASRLCTDEYGCTVGCSDDCCHRWREYTDDVLQSIVSGTHFYLNVKRIPYNLIAEPWCQCVNTQGIWPAGHCAQRRELYPRINVPGALFEAEVVTGLFFLIP